MKKRPYPVGRFFYKKAGLTKVIVIHLTPELYERIRNLAEKDERSLQVTARRILQSHFDGKK
jgi:predicted DNA-binding protein